MAQQLSRRGILGAGAVLAAAGAPSGAALAQAGYDPRRSAEGQVKLTASLDGGPAFWIYTGVIYAVRPSQRPLPILALSGCESHWASRRDDGSYAVGGATLTFFRDVDAGAFLDAWDNPITGKRVAVKPNLLSGGGVIYPADGSSARAVGQIKNAVIAPEGFGPSDPRRALGGLRWSVVGPSVMLMTDRSWNVAVQPQLEAQTQTADKDSFFDPRITRLPARYTATTIIPWMTWMDMAGEPGHLVWHSSGEKVFRPDLIPADYRVQAASLMDRLTARPDF